MIIPSIIAKNFEEVKQKIVQLDGLVDWAQLDIMDGRFVLPTSWDTAEDLEMLDGKIKLEAHLMVKDPDEVLPEWMNYADRVIVHAESALHLADSLEVFDGTPAKFAVALKIDTPLDILDEFVGKISRVQLMSIGQLGYYGAKFDEAIYDRIAEVRARYPEMTIAVDGGVNLANAPKLLSAGVGDLVVGSALWESGDLAGTLKQFQAII